MKAPFFKQDNLKINEYLSHFGTQLCGPRSWGNGAEEHGSKECIVLACASFLTSPFTVSTPPWHCSMTG